MGHCRMYLKNTDHYIATMVMILRRRSAVAVSVVHNDSIPSLFLALTDTLNVTMLSTLNSIDMKS